VGVPIPPWYEGWDVVRLDIEAQNAPDLLMDAMDLDTLDGGQFDATYASHLLEHVYPFDLERFLGGVRHVLVADGFAEFRVPNVLQACEVAAKAGSLDAFCYRASAGVVTAWDMLYGWLPYQQRYGRPMAHHNGFSPKSLSDTLNHHGFPMVYVQAAQFEIGAAACLTDLPDEMKRRMRIDRATGKHRPVHSDDGAADVGAVRLFRAVAELQPAPGDPGHGHPATAPATRRRGAYLPNGAGLGRRL
jgi:hypothetical protein